MLQMHQFFAAERWQTDRRGANGSGAKAAQTNGELHLIARGDPRRPDQSTPSFARAGRARVAGEPFEFPLQSIDS
jgi:hypothetical protein